MTAAERERERLARILDDWASQFAKACEEERMDLRDRLTYGIGMRGWRDMARWLREGGDPAAEFAERIVPPGPKKRSKRARK